MSSTLPLLSELHGVQYGFVGCKPAEAAPEVAPAAEALNARTQPAKRPAAVAVPDAESSSNSAKKCAAAHFHNRIAEVREQQGISPRTMARRLQIDLKSYLALERPERDLRLSELVALQAALDVPMIDLLEDSQSLSRPVAERAKMIKVMKTAAALRETPSSARIERMVQTLCGHLIDLMPELAEVSSWPQYGSRRGSSAIGKVLAQQISIADLGLHE